MKFPRDDYYTDSSETETPYRFNYSPLNSLPRAHSKTGVVNFFFLLFRIKNSIENRNLITNATKPDRKPTKCNEFGWGFLSAGTLVYKKFHERALSIYGHFSRTGSMGS